VSHPLPAPVGVFGGTFDPVHFGHLRPALELRERLGMQRMLMIPCSVPPHRPQPCASAAQRLAMLERAVAGEAALEVDERELRRSGPSYMADTLATLRQELGETPLCLCLGVDAFLGLPEWERWETLLELAHIVVAHRPGWQLQGETLAAPLQRLLATQRSDEPDELAQHPAGRVLLQPVTQLDISATAIRGHIAAGGSARYLLPDAVWDYIRQEKLYV
jgi:nicotinate-nucleotide adenylyltransferase